MLDEPRLLNLIPRTSRLHHDLLDSHQNMEGVFAAWRERYKVAGNDLGTRIRRRAGVTAQNLRASASCCSNGSASTSVTAGWAHTATATPTARPNAPAASPRSTRCCAPATPKSSTCPIAATLSSCSPAYAQPTAARAAAGGRSTHLAELAPPGITPGRLSPFRGPFDTPSERATCPRTTTGAPSEARSAASAQLRRLLEPEPQQRASGRWDSNRGHHDFQSCGPASE